MSSPIRVMLVDDSAVVRKMLAEALSKHREIEVIGTAANGIIALHKLPLLAPELVILDVEMPEMDGITTLQNLRVQYPRLPVIMFSTLTERGAHVTFDALAAGASDYVCKPSSQTGETLATVVSQSLVPKIVSLTRSRFGLAVQAAVAAALGDGNEAPRPAPNRPSTLELGAPANNPFGKASGSGLLASKGLLTKPIAPSLQPTPASSATVSPQRLVVPVKTMSPSQPPTRPNIESLFSRQTNSVRIAPPARASMRSLELGARKSIQLIAIAASTGGPNALAEILPRLPRNLPVPIVIVQHMPPIFTRCLAERLAARSELTVVESAGNERLLPGHVYIAPGHRHLEVERDAEGAHTLLTDAAPENSCRPSADVLFRSVARAYGGAVLCVVLTGMGQDGLRGARELHEGGARVIVQSGPTCTVWGMPKAVEEAGLAEAVVPLSDVALAILQRVGSGLMPLRTPEGSR
jgi:two-component system, chemotaxis family, protein-glutamate methylesterase/glutaminase